MQPAARHPLPGWCLGGCLRSEEGAQHTRQAGGMSHAQKPVPPMPASAPALQLCSGRRAWALLGDTQFALKHPLPLPAHTAPRCSSVPARVHADVSTCSRHWCWGLWGLLLCRRAPFGMFAGLCAQEREHASACAHAAGPPFQQARRSSSNGRAVCAALRLAALAGRSRARVRASRKPAIGHASHSQLRVLCKLSCPFCGQQVRSCRVQGRGLQHAREYEACMVRRTCLARVISWASLPGPVQAATARLGARFIAGPFRFVALADVTG